MPGTTRVFSAIQPSGELHLGNYLGAVRTWAQMVDEAMAPGSGAPARAELLFCVADAHALTGLHGPAELRQRTLRLAGDLIALGTDPERSILFVQSDVPEHLELAWYLGAVTSRGDLQRMTQFKEKRDSNDFVSAALLAYPVLMSADILLYKASVVPVGDDQVQHLELVRETARRFNRRFAPIFPEPQPRFSLAPRIGGLDGDEKMSKSKGNSVGVFESSEALWEKLKGAFTDPQRLRRSDPGRPEICNVYAMHRAVSAPAQQEEVVAHCTSATWGCIDCKKLLFENLERELVPLRLRRHAISDEMVARSLREGAGRARAMARPTMVEVRSAMGLGAHS